MIEPAPLKHCPFCGSTHVDLHRSGPGAYTCYVRCTNCGASTKTDSREAAIAAWNARAESTETNE